MGECEDFMAEATEAAKAIRARADNREIKAQGGTIPKHPASYYGLPDGRAHKITFGENDRKFLQYVRGAIGPGEMKGLVKDETGRILVTSEIEDQIGRRLQEEVVLRQLCSTKQITKDRLISRWYESEPTVS